MDFSGSLDWLKHPPLSLTREEEGSRYQSEVFLESVFEGKTIEAVCFLKKGCVGVAVGFPRI